MDEPDETVAVKGTTTVADFSVTGAELEITDDDAAPTVTLALSDASIGEDGGSATVTASLSHASSEATTVTVAVNPDAPAVSGDYSVSANKALTIAAGTTASTGTVTITGVDNDIDAADKTVRVEGAASNSLGISGPEDVELTLEDNDTRGVTLSKSELEIAEGEDGAYTVVLTSEPTGSVTVTPSRSSGDTDVTVSGALTFTAGDWNTAQTVTVSSAGDTDAADDTAEIGHAVSGADYGGVTVASVDVSVDDDETASGELLLAASPESVDEGAESAVVTVTAKLDGGARSGATFVTLGVGSGTATSGTDFAPVSSFTITIAENELSNTGTFTLSPTNDTVDEPDETVRIRPRSITTGLTVADLLVTIEDNDAAPTVTLSLSDSSIEENGGSATVTASLSHASSEATTVTVSVSPDIPATASDYSLSANTVLMIAAGQTSSTGEVTIAGVDNDVDSADKTVRVQGAAVNSLGATGPSDVQLTLEDDDTASTGVTLTVSPDSVSEGANATTITVTASLNGGTRGESTAVAVTVGSGTATSGTDFAEVAGFTITIPANIQSHTGTFSLSPTQDTVDEPNETVSVTGSVTGLVVTGSEVGITDDDASPTVTLSLSETFIGEDGGSTSVTASLGHASSVVTTVTVSVSPDDPAVAGDYSLSANTLLTIAAGQTASTGEVTITGVNNDVDTLDKTVQVTGIASNSLGVTDPGAEELIVEDDDGVPSSLKNIVKPSSGIAVSALPASVGEGAGDTTVTVRASLDGLPRGTDTEVEIAVGSGTATSGTDFTAVAGFTITIGRSTLSETGTFTLTPTQDTVDEPNETVLVSGTTTVSGFSAAATEVQISDDDASPTVTLALSDTSIEEDGGGASVTASLSHASSVETTVTVSVSPDAPAVAGDYALSANTTLTIAAGRTASTGAVTVTGVDNDVDAPDKTVRVRGAAVNSLGATGPSEVELTLEDDDTRGVTVSLEDLELDEGDDDAYTLVLTSEPTGSVTVTPSRTSGDSDVTVSGALTFTAGDWNTAQTVTVSAGEDRDAADDAAEIGHAVSGADYGGVTVASVDVRVDDDETASSGVTLTVSPGSVGEGAGATTVTVTATLNGGTRGEATPVAVTVDSGTATSGTDFAAVRRIHDHGPRQYPVAHGHVRADTDTGHGGRAGRDGPSGVRPPGWCDGNGGGDHGR